MTIKFLLINDYAKIKHLTNIESLENIECISIDNLSCKISDIQHLNLPINLNQIIIDFNIKEEARKRDAEFEFKTYTEAIEFIKDLANQFKLPFDCKLTFRFCCNILHNKEYMHHEFIYSNNKIIYDTYIDGSYKGKISKSYIELCNIINNELEKYSENEIFGVSCKYVNIFCNLLNDLNYKK